MDIRLVVEILILIFLVASIYLYFFRERKKKDGSTSNSEIKEEISLAIKDHLKSASESFLILANENLEKHNETAQLKLKSNTEKVEKDVKSLKDEMGSLGKNLAEAVQNVKTSGTDLGQHIDGLSNNLQAWNQAMASNKVRGDLGEEALEKILTDSGLQEGANYYKQQHKTVDGVTVKPDIVVELANGGNLVIDSKFPYDDFRRAVEEKDASKQEEHYKRHAESVLKHVKDLSKKNYFSYLNSSPEYTVLYLNNVIYYYHALRLIPDFVDQARKLNIIVATPEIVIPLLSGVMQQWKEHRVMADIGKVSNEVSVLHSRLKTFMGHMSDISKELGKAGAKVNSVFSSYNKSVLPSIRRIEDITAQSDEIEELKVESSLEKNSQ